MLRSRVSDKSILLARLIYTYVIKKGQSVSQEERKRDIGQIERHGLRNIMARMQARRLYGVKGFKAGRELLETLRDKQLIFVISFHKNGTRSIHTYLEKLGYVGMHWPVFTSTGVDYETIMHPIASDSRHCVEALAPLFAVYDFFDDVPFPGLFRELAESFPDSKFILTKRPAQEWWESIWRHWRKWDPEGNSHRLSVFEAIQYGLPVGTVITESDRLLLTEKYVTHNEAVEEYFSGTNRLLTADLTDPNINEQISEFLGHAGAPQFPKIREGAV